MERTTKKFLLLGVSTHSESPRPRLLHLVFDAADANEVLAFAHSLVDHDDGEEIEPDAPAASSARSENTRTTGHAPKHAEPVITLWRDGFEVLALDELEHARPVLLPKRFHRKHSDE